jgi:crotonobetaine/carnitine-CoA ligase
MDIVGNRTLYSVFLAHAKHQPDRQWLTYESAAGDLSRWTFAEFLDSVHQAINLIQACGIGDGDVINLHLANNPVFVQLILAASYLGVTVLPTSPSATPAELRYLLKNSEAKLSITEACYAKMLEKSMPRSSYPILLTGNRKNPHFRYRCYEAELERQCTRVSGGLGSSEKLVQLLYTSGTTAQPKGVLLTNANFIYGSEVLRAATGLRSDDHQIIVLPLYHAAAQCHALWPSIIAGAAVSIMSRFSASKFFEQAARHEATMAALFGTLLRMLLSQPPGPWDRAHFLRNVTYAQNLSTLQYEEWRQRFGAPLQQVWGMTEIGALPLMSPLTGERRLNAMGRPVIGYEVRVVDDSGAEVFPHAAGELIVRGVPGRSLALGYLKNAIATDKLLRREQDGTWLHTGDIAAYDQDGFFYFLDRSKDLIKRGGLNISTAEVESVIAEIPGVAEVCVVGLPDAIRDEVVAAAVVRCQVATPTADQIRSHCAARLADYKVPARVEFMDCLPKTSVGKCQKIAVREQLLEVAPGSPNG